MLQVEHVLHHLLTTFSTMLRRVAVSFGVVFIAVVAITEAVGAALTNQFPPNGLTHLVAVFLAFSLGLNIALFVAIEEGLRGFVRLLGDVAKATEEAAAKVVQEVEKEGGELLHGAGHVVQNIEHGAVTAVRDVAQVPGHVIGGIEGGVQGIERRITGQEPGQS